MDTHKSSITLSTSRAYNILYFEILDIINTRTNKYQIKENSLEVGCRRFYIKNERFCVDICGKLAGNCPDFGILSLYIDLLQNKYNNI